MSFRKGHSDFDTDEAISRFHSVVQRIKKPILFGLVPLVIGFSCLTYIPTGYVGVITTPSGLDPVPRTAGLTFINPLADVEKVNVKLRPHQAQAHAASHDLQDLATSVTVPWSITDSQAPKFIKNFGGETEFVEAILNPGIQETIKAVTAHFQALTILQKREPVRDQFEEALNAFVKAALEKRKVPGVVIIGRVTIDNVKFVPTFQTAVEARVKAEQDRDQSKQVGNKIRREAEGEAAKIKAEADAEAYKTLQLARQEADNIRRQAKAIEQNPSLIDLTAINNWDGAYPEQWGSKPLQVMPLDSGRSPVPQAK